MGTTSRGVSSLWTASRFGAPTSFSTSIPTSRPPSPPLARSSTGTAQDATFFFVTNEIGLGGVSENKIQRRFTDLQGWMNQYIAERADEVVLMVSGIPVKVK